MSDILGHDINGRPLRAGDEVVVVNPWFREHQDLLVLITGPSHDPVFPLYTDIWDDFSMSYRTTSGGRVRKLDNHQPANESFHEMLDNLKQVEA